MFTPVKESKVLNWPISSSRKSDIPTQRKHRRRTRKKIPENQRLIDTFLARSSSDRSSLSELSVKRSLFGATNGKVERSQTLIKDFFGTSSKGESKKMCEKEDDDAIVSSMSELSILTDDKEPDKDNLQEASTSVENRINNKEGDVDDEEEENDSINIRPMFQTAEVTFRAFVEENEWGKAVDFITMMTFQKPSVSTMQVLLHKILLRAKSPLREEPQIFRKAECYLRNILCLYPPINTVSISYYEKVIFDYDKQNKANWSKWDTVMDIIKCCKKKSSFSKLQCDNNCLLLLQYLVAVFRKEYDLFVSARSTTPTKYKDCPKLIRNLIWPDREPSSSSRVARNLIKEIDTIFSFDFIEESQRDLLVCLLGLLCLSVECSRIYENLTEENAITFTSSTALREIHQCIYDCENIQRSPENLAIFMESIELIWLRLAIGENFLSGMCYGSWNANIRREPFTLRKIIFNYMFYSPDEVFQQDEDDFETNLFSRTKKKIKIRTTSNGKTQLHKFAAAGANGKMWIALKKNPELYQLVNAVDGNGWTPLHDACYNKNAYPCALMLLDSENKGGPACNVLAAEKNGLIPLHLAVCVDSAALVNKLLNTGDACEQMKTKNKQGLTPFDLVESHKIRIMFERHLYSKSITPSDVAEGIPEEIVNLLETGSVVKFSSFAEYEKYACCLEYTVGYFCEFYDIKRLFNRYMLPDTDISLEIKSHLGEKHHFNVDNMLDNLVMLRYFRLVVENFRQKIRISMNSYLGGEHDLDFLYLDFYTTS